MGMDLAKACSAEVPLELLLDFLFDRALEHADHQAELRVHADMLVPDFDPSLDSGAPHQQGVSLPLGLHAVAVDEVFADSRRDFPGAIAAQAMPPSDINGRHCGSDKQLAPCYSAPASGRDPIKVHWIPLDPHVRTSTTTSSREMV